MYVYMYFCKIKPCLVTIFFLFLERKWICHDTLTFYSFCFSFHLEGKCSHVLNLWYRGKRRQYIKPLLYYLEFKEKQLRCENTLIVFIIIIKRLKTSRSPLITNCYSQFLPKFIHLTIFHSVSIFNGFIPLVIVMILHVFINLYVWLILIRVWHLTCWEWPTNVTLINVLSIISVYYLQE